MTSVSKKITWSSITLIPSCIVNKTDFKYCSKLWQSVAKNKVRIVAPSFSAKTFCSYSTKYQSRDDILDFYLEGIDSSSIEKHLSVSLASSQGFGSRAEDSDDAFDTVLEKGFLDLNACPPGWVSTLHITLTPQIAN